MGSCFYRGSYGVRCLNFRLLVVELVSAIASTSLYLDFLVKNIIHDFLAMVQFYLLHLIIQSTLKKTTLDFHNFMFIYDGEATFFKNGTMFKGKKDDLIYYEPGDIREAYSSDSFPMKCFAVEFLYTCPILSNSKWCLSSQKLPLNSNETIEDTLLYHQLFDLFSKLIDLKLSIKTTINPATAIIKETTVFMEILALLFQYKNGNRYNYFNIKRVDKVINYMIQHYSEPLDLKNLADYLEISPSYLFKKITGKSVISYLIDIRINKAKQFLKDELSVSETAHRVGYNDIFYFSRIFKKRERVSPSEFIKIHS